MRSFISFTLCWATLLSAGCQAIMADAKVPLEPTSSPIARAVPPYSPEPQMTPSLPADAGLQNLIEKAKEDLIEQFNFDAEKIQVVEARAVTWPDASLGCPQPALIYTQVLTPGYWVLLEANDTQYPYHADQAHQLILCQREGTPISPFPRIPVNPGEIKDGDPWVPVN